MKEDYYNQKYLGTVLFEDNQQLIENVWLTVSSEAMYFETSVQLPSRKRWKVIQASFNKVGDDLTLLECETRGGYSGGSAGRVQKVFISQILFGLKLSEHKLKFKGIVLISPAFTKWVQQTERIEYSDGYRKARIPEREIIEKIETEEYKLKIIADYATMNNSYEFHAKHQMVIKVTSKTLKTVDDFLQIANKIRKFILFVTNENPEFSHLTLLNEEKYKLPMWWKTKQFNEKKFSQNLWIRYLHTRKHLADILVIWLSDEKLELAIDLILSRQYNTKMSNSAYFFNTCVALESNFDRFRAFNYEEHEDEVKSKIQDIEKRLENTDYLEWFQQKSEYWTQLTLFKKFKHYQQTIVDIGSTTFPFKPRHLLRYIVDTRNDIAHRAESTNHFNSIELFLVGKLLEFTFKIELLRFFKVDVEKKENNLVRTASSHLRMLATLNNYNVPPKDDKPFKLGNKR